MATIEEIRRKAHVKLFGDKMVIHWTGLRDTGWERGFEQIIEAGKLDAGTSFTSSADLSYPLDNDKPVGLVFRREDIQQLGYRNLPLDQKGVTAMEIAYELTGGREVSLDLLQGVVSYRPAVLKSVRKTLRKHRAEYGSYSDLPSEIRTKLIGRPKYDMFDTPKQLAEYWKWSESQMREVLYGGRTVELPAPRRPVRVHWYRRWT